MTESEKEYIVWSDYGYEGWLPTRYETLEEAMNHNSYGNEKVITKKVKFTVLERITELNKPLTQEE